MSKYSVPLFLLLLFTLVVPVSALAETEGTLQERLQRIVDEKQITLQDPQRSLVVDRCESVQNALRDQATKTEVAVRTRQSNIDAIQQDMLALKLRLSRQSTDASELELLRGRLQQYNDDFTISSAAYGQAVNDALTVSCRERPELFIAALMTVRQYRTAQFKAASGMTKALKDAPSTTIPAIKHRLVL